MLGFHTWVTKQLKQIRAEHQTIVLSPQPGDHREIILRKIRVKAIVRSPQPNDNR